MVFISSQRKQIEDATGQVLFLSYAAETAKACERVIVFVEK